MEWYQWVIVVVGSIIFIGYAYIYVVKDWLEYRKARKEIFAFVKSYRPRCAGSNRFEVTAESLQDSFREYDMSVILKVWLDLVHERVIEQDPQDSTWCIR